MKLTWAKQFARATRIFAADESGPTAVEYAVMLALIIITAIAAIQSFGAATSTSFSNSVNSINAAS